MDTNRKRKTSMTGEFLYEGKAKKIYQHDIGKVKLQFKDDATAGNRAKEAQFVGKGELNCDISATMFNKLHKHKIATHFIEKISPTEHICHQVKIIPLEVIVRNIAAGTFCKRYGMEVGKALKNTIIEFCIKDDDLNDPPIAEDAITALGITDKLTLHYLRKETTHINEVLTSIFTKCKLKLVDFKLEFGLTENGTILLADEVCPDTMRLWNDKNESFDKDLFRNDSGDLLAGYREVQRLLNES
jgi:phosphoribosylaminoimidazole-succinocarboxamide synthase|tara:strand:- start:70 stop:801 length:732 start_codon:yes stop_codon:yes gene_type:complete